MNRATHAVIAAVILAAFAMAQDAPAPPAPPETPATPQTPVTPTTPETPATPATPRTPRAPRAPRAPRPPRTESRRSYLGIDSRDVTPERASALHLQNSSGVEVMMVDQDAPAGKAGLKEHDVIVKFNGKTVEDPYELRNFIRDVSPGNTVTLGIIRDGKPMDVKVNLVGRPVWDAGMIHIPPIHIPPMDINIPTVIMAASRNGLTVEPITRQMAEAFGSKEGHGVMIRSVEKNSAAENAGFRAGDVIVRVGNDIIDNVNDWNQAIRQQSAGKVNVTVIREKREQNLTLAVPEKRSEGSALDLHGMDGDLADMQVQIAGIGPEIQKSMEEWQKEWQKTWNSAEFQKELAETQREAQREARKAMELNRAEIQKQVEQARKEAEKARKDWEQQQKEWQKDWQKQLPRDDQE